MAANQGPFNTATSGKQWTMRLISTLNDAATTSGFTASKDWVVTMIDPCLNTNLQTSMVTATLSDMTTSVKKATYVT